MRGFANSRLLVVTNAGHNSQLRPPAVVTATAGFFRGDTPTATADYPSIAFLPMISTGKN